MGWTLLALASAFTFALADALQKRFFSHLTPLLMTAVRLVWVVPFALAGFLLLTPVRVEPGFWGVVALLIPLEIAATFFYMYAIKVSPLSLTLPFQSFTPVFLIFTGLIILGELPSHLGAAGILLVFFGGYLIFLTPETPGLLAPIRAMTREKGTVAMLAVALIYAFTSAGGKLAIILSDPVSFAAIYFLALGPVVFTITFTREGKNIKRVFETPIKCLLVGFVLSVSIVCHVYAIAMVKAAYFIAVKRISLVFGILFGWLMFSEANIPKRLLGGALMVLGVAVINLWGR